MTFLFSSSSWIQAQPTAELVADGQLLLWSSEDDPKPEAPDDCPIGGGLISFAKESAVLSRSILGQLDKLAGDMIANPQCRGVIVWGSTGGSKFQQQLDWVRMNAVVDYLVEEHKIVRSHFYYKMEGGASVNDLGYRAISDGESAPLLQDSHPPYPDIKVPVGR